MFKSKYIIGIDEVGRGPIAGPVAVCALAIYKNKFFDKEGKCTMVHFEDFRDSKKLSHSQRLKWLEKINLEREKGNILYKVSFASNKIVDKQGIVFAINKCLKNSLDYLKSTNNKISIDHEKCLVLLDGGLKAPKEYVNQETIIKGDEKELAIALASIVAKEARDTLMIKLAIRYPNYDLEKHKGYGTKKHYQALKKLGLSPIHRRSFLKSNTT